MSKHKFVRVKSPCDYCNRSQSNGGNCENGGTCGRWSAWFCEYWRKLREKYIPGLKEANALRAEYDAERGE